MMCSYLLNNPLMGQVDTSAHFQVNAYKCCTEILSDNTINLRSLPKSFISAIIQVN